MSEVSIEVVQGETGTLYTYKDSMGFSTKECRFKPQITREWITEFNSLPSGKGPVRLTFEAMKRGKHYNEELTKLAQDNVWGAAYGSVICIEGVGKLNVVFDGAKILYLHAGREQQEAETSIKLEMMVVRAELEGLYHDEDRKNLGLVCEKCKEPLQSIENGRAGCGNCGKVYEVNIQETTPTAGVKRGPVDE